ncbi:MAG TPA: winged helix-turn-helix domain-containing protein [Dyella sp.]|nr:winged helix-turn-helix domain-containing protein [Dyella sp.]
MASKESGSGGHGTSPYRFDDIVVDPAAHVLLRAGQPHPVEPKSFAVLLALIERHGELVTRDELLDRVWGHRHVTPGVLTRAIAQLRHALGDDFHEPRYIQTRHALGYCFIAQPEPAREAVPVEGSGADERPAVRDPPVVPAGDDAWPADPRVSWRSPRLMRWLAGLASAVLALTVLWSMLRSNRSAPVPHASVAVLPFTSPGAQPEDDYFAAGLSEEIRDALAGIAGLRVAVPVSADARRDAADTRALGERLGVATVLEATVQRDASRLHVAARLTDTRSGAVLWSQRYDRELDDVFQVQADIAGRVVQSLLGIPPGDALRRRLAPTRDEVAFDAYLQGRHLMHEVSGTDHADAAIRRFGQALARDAGFARAQASICRTEIGQFQDSRSADAFQRASDACLRAAQMDPSLAEVDLAQGDLYRVQGDLARAMAYYLKAARSPATGASAHVGMAKIYAAQGKRGLALTQFREALEDSPGDPRVYAQIGDQQYLDGQLAQAVESYRKAVALQPGYARNWSTLGALAMEAGDTDEASRALQRAVALSPDAASLGNLGLLKYQAGDYPAAVALQRRAVQAAPDDFMPWANLGQALAADPANAAAATEAYRQAARRAEAYVRLKPDDARASAALGLYRAILGDAAGARELVERSEAMDSQPGPVALFNAQTLGLLGDPDQARQRLARARSAGMAEGMIDSNLTLRRLGLVSTDKPGPAASSPSDPGPGILP